MDLKEVIVILAVVVSLLALWIFRDFRDRSQQAQSAVNALCEHFGRIESRQPAWASLTDDEIAKHFEQIGAEFFALTIIDLRAEFRGIDSFVCYARGTGARFEEVSAWEDRRRASVDLLNLLLYYARTAQRTYPPEFTLMVGQVIGREALARETLGTENSFLNFCGAIEYEIDRVAANLTQLPA